MYFTGCSFVTIGNYFTSLGLGFLINKNGSNDAPPRRVVVRRRGKGMYSTYLRQTLIDASFLPPSLCYSTQLTWTQRQITNTRSIWKHWSKPMTWKPDFNTCFSEEGLSWTPTGIFHPSPMSTQKDNIKIKFWSSHYPAVPLVTCQWPLGTPTHHPLLVLTDISESSRTSVHWPGYLWSKNLRPELGWPERLRPQHHWSEFSSARLWWVLLHHSQLLWFEALWSEHHRLEIQGSDGLHILFCCLSAGLQ